MAEKGKVKTLICKLLHDGTSYEDLVRLVQITTTISKSYLKQYYPSFLRICAQDGWTEHDLAKDSILEIFQRNDQGVFLCLQNFCDSLDHPIKKMDEEEVLFAYEAYVQTFAIRQLVENRYKNVDPAGKKIYRNIRDYIRRTDTVTLTKDFRGYVIKPSDYSPAEQSPPFPRDELEKRFTIRDPKATTVPEMLSRLMEILKNQSLYRRSLRLYHVIQIFKRYYGYISNHEPRQKHEIDLSALTKFDHDLIKSKVLQRMREKILTTYVVSNKVELQEASSLYRTIADIINEWFDPEAERSPYFHHASANFQIDESQYEERWRTKIEYLVRIAREQIEDYLMNGL